MYYKFTNNEPIIVFGVEAFYIYPYKEIKHSFLLAVVVDIRLIMLYFYKMYLHHNNEVILLLMQSSISSKSNGYCRQDAF